MLDEKIGKEWVPQMGQNVGKKREEMSGDRKEKEEKLIKIVGTYSQARWMKFVLGSP